MKARNEIGQLLNEHNLLGTGVEVGVFAGVFSEIILNTWKGKHLILVDAWASLPGYNDFLRRTDKLWIDTRKESKEEWEKILTECRERLSRFGLRASILRMESLEAAKTCLDWSLDFVYLDADHSKEAVEKDLRAWYPKLKKGGLFSGHDYFSGMRKGVPFGVKDAVDAFAKQEGKAIGVTAETSIFKTWYFFK